jgi:DNA-binding response OmpR family regulator
MESDIQKGREAGFLRYLTKPIKVDEMMLALNAALEISELSNARPASRSQKESAL